MLVEVAVTQSSRATACGQRKRRASASLGASRAAQERAGAAQATDPLSVSLSHSGPDSAPQSKRPKGREGQRHSNEHSKKRLLDRLHDLTVARVPLDAIAKEFGVTVRTVSNWKRELHERYRDEALLFDPMPFLGRARQHYESIRAAGLRIAVNGRSASERLGGLQVALAAENDLHRFLKLSGFYKAVPFVQSMRTEHRRNSKDPTAIEGLTERLVADMQGAETNMQGAETMDLVA